MLTFRCHVNYLGDQCAGDPEVWLNQILFHWSAAVEESPCRPPVNVLVADIWTRPDEANPTRRGMAYACDAHLATVIRWLTPIRDEARPIGIERATCCPACRGIGLGQDLNALGIGPTYMETDHGSRLVHACPTCRGTASLPYAGDRAPGRT